jgi:site-specific DNA-methyltransferase (adenine-specific)
VKQTYNGDCLEILRKLPDCSLDSLVTDPPAGISFMGKAWDDDKGGRDEWVKWLSEVMRECLRVMKPGAHGMVWSLPRTSHWTGTALEQAGFEVRDVVSHLFGSGFPKSMNIGKAIDKMNGDERPVIGSWTPTGTARPKVGAAGHSAGRTSAADPNYIAQTGVTLPITSAASAAWEGWGTALKPAAEFWWLIRKPLSEKTVAVNVLKWGTGALNIDGGRIGYSENEKVDFTRVQDGNIYGSGETYGKGEQKQTTPLFKPNGRFPANLVLSCVCEPDQHDAFCPVHMLDEQSGQRPAGYRSNPSTQSGSKFQSNGGAGERGYKDTGGASRFFYCAKVSASERNAGLDTKNTHPTLKPLRLMRYFCRLVTPPGGKILDPFMGSGSTGVAALSEGFQFVGIEREPEYHAIAEKRMESA